ncbi:glycoside hydrolase family 28 protein [Asticcacaulis sp. EMRT-3]|uniref:rhamnogalacturonidase n=1 Tax=Asticcacaulis sp. EMRT-3 TaxID=3040349 RepID=UPI0024AFF6ED|nr:glycoside hydrolase family 28 protein [Asticcacaulis sp. EMRT-3]MDI7776438.1 glycoside hydrolase family 28 protein [Asticcacaulis sp. EMRT-3]
MFNRRHLLLSGGAGLLAVPSFMNRRAFAAPLSAGMFNIRDFGAKGDGVNMDSGAINTAIDEAARRGGGTVFFPAGTYASYSIRLKSHVTLYLDQGAVLLAASVPLEGTTTGGYDAAEPQDPAYEAFQDYGHNHWHNSLIWAENQHDMAILGDGMIWGKGLSRGHPDPDLPRADLPGVGNKSIAFKNCFNVELRDFKILQGGWFGLLATGVDNLVIDNLIVDTNRDGFDIDCCKNVRVSNCTVNSPYDDAIVPKSSFALGYARVTENVTISDCAVSGSYVVGSVLDGTFRPTGPGQGYTTGRIKCGTESNGGFKNITISNCVFDQCQGLALESEDGAILEDITITNITMRGITSAPLFLRLGRRMRGPKGAAIGSIKRVLINNITSSGASPLPSILAGIDGHPVSDIQISHVYFEQAGGGDAAMKALNPPEKADQYPEPGMFGPLPATGFFIRHAANIDLSHVEIAVKAADARPAFWLQDVEGFDGSFLKVPTGAPAFHLDRVTGFRTFGSRAITDRQMDVTTPVDI